MEREGLTTDDIQRLCRKLGIDLGKNPKRMLEFWCEQRLLPYRQRRRIAGRTVWAFPPSAEACLGAIAAGKREGRTMPQIAERCRLLVEGEGRGEPGIGGVPERGDGGSAASPPLRPGTRAGASGRGAPPPPAQPSSHRRAAAVREEVQPRGIPVGILQSSAAEAGHPPPPGRAPALRSPSAFAPDGASADKPGYFGGLPQKGEGGSARPAEAKREGGRPREALEGRDPSTALGADPKVAPTAIPPSQASRGALDLLGLVRDLWQGGAADAERIRAAARSLGLTPAEVIERLEAARFLEVMLGEAERTAGGLELERLAKALRGES